MSARRVFVMCLFTAVAMPTVASAESKPAGQPKPAAQTDAKTSAKTSGKTSGKTRGRGTEELEPLVTTSPLVTNNCLGCHDESMLDQQRLTAKQWMAEVKKMQGWGAPIEPENMEALARYLSDRYGAEDPNYEFSRIGAEEAQAAVEPQSDWPYQASNTEKGAKLYVAGCEKCHGADGKGTPMGVVIADRPILWHAEEFATVIRKGRGRMPRFPFSKADIGALLAHLRELHPSP
jgi:mono/diheme cytochrome c family protein